jgi:hypothetical protein
MEQQIPHLQESIIELEKNQLTNAKVSIAETMKHTWKKNIKSDGTNQRTLKLHHHLPVMAAAPTKSPKKGMK